MQPKFSIVLIARNEAITLPKLLESLKEFRENGGEICLLDTGSTDNTVEIAKSYKCIVNEVGDMFKLPVKNTQEINDRFIVENEESIVKQGDTYFNFSAARNHAASFASNNFIFCYDADEVSVNMNIEKINELIESGATQFEYNFVFAYDQWNNEAIKFIQCKAYDRTKIEWRGIIHELLTPFKNEDLKTVLLEEKDYKLGHYQNHETGRHSYLKGLAVDCYNNPVNDRHSHYLARELMWNNRPHSALKEFKRHVTLNGWATERAQSLIFIGDIYGRLNDSDKQLEYYNKAYNLETNRREALLRIANFYKHHNNPQPALCYAAAANEIPYNGYYANTMSQYTYEPHEIMYWAYGWLGNIPKAQEHILKCLRYKPLELTYLRDVQYYFEYPGNDIEGWMQFSELQWLYNTAKDKDNILEVGSWKGKSTHALLSGTKGHVTAVDCWKGSGDSKDATYWIGQQEDILSIFKKNVEGFDNLNIHTGYSPNVSKDFLDEQYDMIFIDAGHEYEEVKADIEAWLPKVKPGGIICGHDYQTNWPGVLKAVDEKFGHPDGVDTTIWYVKKKI